MNDRWAWHVAWIETRGLPGVPMALFTFRKNTPNRRTVRSLVTKVAAELVANEEFVSEQRANASSERRITEASNRRKTKLIQDLSRHRAVDLAQASRLVVRLGLSNAREINEILGHAERMSR